MQSAVVAMMGRIVYVLGNASKPILEQLNKNVQILEDDSVPLMNYPEINVAKQGVLLMIN